MKSSRENIAYRFREKDKLRAFSKDKWVAIKHLNYKHIKIL